jgi:hypothetical protein
MKKRTNRKRMKQNGEGKTNFKRNIISCGILEGSGVFSTGKPNRHRRTTVTPHILYRDSIQQLTVEVVDNFWEKVDTTPGYGPKGDCWAWTGCADRLGYGVITMKPLHILAHRVSWFLEHGVLLCGNKVQLQHHCDNPPCVNPEHLFDGTQMDNVHDCMEKGRFNPGYVCGEQVGNHKLTAEEVLEIREKYDGVREGYAAIGKEYGVDQTNIGYILRRKTWKHI